MDVKTCITELVFQIIAILP